ncbi:hypothetical protein Q0F99_06980 [Rathayibacter oskolensis]|uniref:hypothetical protein n=1 Tax=Rathayibacter oskolensis TaxID=1891671 RepID=UPI0026601F3E|nr:hypothetical protein [Rathayibacter oskolensis]WKK72668.1 hypothetical protein Q0F99_06980 [Rathayibacter oskolensis]
MGVKVGKTCSKLTLCPSPVAMMMLRPVATAAIHEDEADDSDRAQQRRRERAIRGSGVAGHRERADADGEERGQAGSEEHSDERHLTGGSEEE